MQNDVELITKIDQIIADFTYFVNNELHYTHEAGKNILDNTLKGLLDLRQQAKTRNNKYKVTAALKSIVDIAAPDREIFFKPMVSKFFTMDYKGIKPDIYFVPGLILPRPRCKAFQISSNSSGFFCMTVYSLLSDVYSILINPVDSGKDDEDSFTNTFKRISEVIKVHWLYVGLGESKDPDIVTKEICKQFVEFIYDCFDNIEVQPDNIKAIEAELSKSDLFKPYYQQEIQARTLSVVSVTDLRTALESYQSESWLGWFWNVALCGVFGRHQSYTIAALQTMCDTQSQYCLESEIISCIKNAEPYYAKQRIGFFTHPCLPMSGTDRVLQQIRQSVNRVNKEQMLESRAIIV